MNRLGRVAPLHDLGKISVPEEILDKPGTLTREEFNEMKKHTLNGACIMDIIMGAREDDQDYQMAKEIALYHHEKWQGAGYPYGKSGKEIPLSARIMAVADVFDALMSERPYKRAYTMEEALCIMKEEGDSHFDPEVLEAFFSIKSEIEEISLQHETEQRHQKTDLSKAV